MFAYKVLSTPLEATESIAVQKEALRSVKVKLAASNSAENYISIDGRLAAYQKVNLTANVSGILLSTSKVAKKGTYFNEGELIFEIDQRKANFNIRAMRSSLMNAITLMMPDLKIDHPIAFTNWKNYLDDFDIEKTISTLPSFTTEQEKYFVSARNIHQLYYNIKSAETQLIDYKIYAPFSGVITQSNIFAGSMVMPGQPLATIINSNHYELEAPITEQDLSFIKVGNPVQLFAANSDKKWTGKVQRIGNQIDPSTQSIPIYIKVSGTGLKEGMYLNGRLKGSSFNNVISIPKELIINQEYVYILKDSIIHSQQLEIENSDDNYVYAAALSPDTWMILDDPRGLYKGQKVQPIFEEK